MRKAGNEIDAADQSDSGKLPPYSVEAENKARKVFSILFTAFSALTE